MMFCCDTDINDERTITVSRQTNKQRPTVEHVRESSQLSFTGSKLMAPFTGMAYSVCHSTLVIQTLMRTNEIVSLVLMAISALSSCIIPLYDN